ncbi:MAG: YidC/Oxa1 family membrane protein insertase, partial [Cyanobacteria bacterium REEB65]|nr:YidC/Oxa1 family membrane protein insertase [Cyanobacteria bacterium REEB65]
ALYASLRSVSLVTAIKSAPPAQQGFLFIQNMLNQGVILRQAHGPTIFHWDNLVLIALFVVTSYATQRMMTTNPNDPMQRQMLFMAPLMGPLIGWALPSGILLYFVVSGLFTIGQYFILLRRFPTLAPLGANAATTLPAATPPKGETNGAAKAEAPQPEPSDAGSESRKAGGLPSTRRNRR